MANVLTSLRIVGTLVLLFLEPLSLPFYWVYTLSGITDALDGFIARLTRTVSSLGAKLDSAADLLFYGVILFLLLPLLSDKLPHGIWFWVLGIFVLRLFSYGIAYRRTREFFSPHTVLNKMSGLIMFLVPYFYPTEFFFPYCLFLCAVASLAALADLFTALGISSRSPRQSKT